MRADSAIGTFQAKASPGTPEYKTRVAEPTMTAVDGLPKAYRAMVHEHGYIDVYLAWRKGMSVAEIQHRAAANGGLFEMQVRRLP